MTVSLGFAKKKKKKKRILLVQLFLNPTFALEQVKFKYFPESRWYKNGAISHKTRMLHGVISLISHDLMCVTSHDPRISHEQFCGKFLDFDSSWVLPQAPKAKKSGWDRQILLGDQGFGVA